MKIIHLGESHSLLNHYVSQLRDVHIQQDRLRFRRNLRRIGSLMAYEISKTLEYAPVDVTTPLGISTDWRCVDQPVIATVLRAGLPFQEGFLEVFDSADAAFVSAYRHYTDDRHFDIKTEYVSSPGIEDKTLLIVDPMLATGKSLEQCYRILTRDNRPKAVHLAVVIASRPAIDYLQSRFADAGLTLWTAAVDPGIDAHSYIVPGLGDAGDLSYGQK